MMMSGSGDDGAATMRAVCDPMVMPSDVSDVTRTMPFTVETSALWLPCSGRDQAQNLPPAVMVEILALWLPCPGVDRAHGLPTAVTVGTLALRL